MINLIKCSAKILYKKLIIIFFLIIYKRPKFKKKIKLKNFKIIKFKIKGKIYKIFQLNMKIYYY